MRHKIKAREIDSRLKNNGTLEWYGDARKESHEYLSRLAGNWRKSLCGTTLPSTTSTSRERCGRARK
ncbi:unnamed protein product, partial [Ascophyllum nodosum]